MPTTSVSLFIFQVYIEGKDQGQEYQSKLFNIHTNPRIHPMVVSPLNASQFNTRSNENAVPYTNVVNRINAVAAA